MQNHPQNTQTSPIHIADIRHDRAVGCYESIRAAVLILQLHLQRFQCCRRGVMVGEQLQQSRVGGLEHLAVPQRCCRLDRVVVRLTVGGYAQGVARTRMFRPVPAIDCAGVECTL